MKLRYNNSFRNVNFSKKTLIYSDENSVGKSTLLRLLFFGLGYPIPGTYGLKFKKMIIEIEYERKGSLFSVRREGDYVELMNEGKFVTSRVLRGDDEDWFSLIWGISSNRILKNILGAIYMDQDKGWTLLNRGKVIGNIRFNIRDLLIGLSGQSEALSEKITILENRKSMLRQTKLLLDVSRHAQEYSNTNYGVDETIDDNIDAKFKNLKLKSAFLRHQKKNIEKNIHRQEGLLDYISSLNLIVKVNDREVPITKKNILNFNDNEDFLRQRLALVQDELDFNEQNLVKIKKIMSESTGDLFKSQDIIERTMDDISRIDFDPTILQARESELLSSISDLNSQIEKQFIDSNDLINETREWINVFSEKLGVKNIVENKKYIFTRDLKSISGAIYYKVVFAFKMAYVKVIEQHLKISLPIVLDSPSGREVTDRNISAVIGILNEYFINNQIIIASIRNYDLNNVKKVVIDEKIFDD
ncbi:hypothetical protein [Lacticaseibacillus rhamnosus]|uniref:hypothetical protein n=1 Tax=Lacticaseibacillus rhamnosus TaxID=47715 RepID=UPI00114D2CBE|nr:hypothetical protein [Lacticaseibacillus rhamnosus]MBS4971896.1 hypothetical protein [Lacticaseibacillus rhamnosus]MDK7184215.1 hypothetical protein [Lacticaseibacillus rhamnosus]MDK7241294.1 hypothetical protein [Lacticaseibacillus rhamnosus]MDT8865148.1 hypothetical protein [Lacticaseibacillus rhamnosus]